MGESPGQRNPVEETRQVEEENCLHKYKTITVSWVECMKAISSNDMLEMMANPPAVVEKRKSEAERERGEEGEAKQMSQVVIVNSRNVTIVIFFSCLRSVFGKSCPVSRTLQTSTGQVNNDERRSTLKCQTFTMLSKEIKNELIMMEYDEDDDDGDQWLGHICQNLSHISKIYYTHAIPQCVSLIHILKS